MLFTLIFSPFGLTDVVRYQLGAADVLVKLWNNHQNYRMGMIQCGNDECVAKTSLIQTAPTIVTIRHDMAGHREHSRH